MNFLFSKDEKLRLVLMEWILMGKIWKKAEEEIRSNLMTNIIVLNELDAGARIINDDLSWMDRIKNKRFEWYLKEMEHNFCDSAFLRKIPKHYDEIELKFFR